MKEFFEENLSIANVAVDDVDFIHEGIYAQFLAQTYYFVSHSTRLLALAASRFTVKQEELHQRFIQHMSEEKGHHFVALQDLNNLGYKIEVLPELYSTRMLYETQYYKCLFLDPVVFFGYVLALEGIASTRGKAIYPIVKEKYGKECSVFICIHAEEDPDHLALAFEYINTLRPDQIVLIKENFIQTCHAYRLFLEEIQRNPAKKQYGN